MKECLNDIRTEVQTLRNCVERLSMQIKKLERQFEEAERLLEPASAPENPEAALETPAPSPRWIDRVNAKTSLRHSLSLNDSFRFTRELFEGNAARMNRMMDTLNEADTLEAAIKLLKEEVPLPDENEAMAEFMEILRKHFN